VVRADHRCRQGRAARCVMSHALDMRRHRQEWRLRGFETGPLDRRSPRHWRWVVVRRCHRGGLVRRGQVMCAAVTNGDVPSTTARHGARRAWWIATASDGTLLSNVPILFTVDDAGEVLTYDRTWSAPIDVDDGRDLVSVSCTSPHFCLAVSEDSPATTYRFDGATWSSVAVPNPSTPQGGSSRTSSPGCRALPRSIALLSDDFGEAFIWNGRDWSGPSPLTRLARWILLCHALLLTFA